MPKSMLVVSGRYHFGDSPGIFQDATYVGHQLVLPVRKVWLDEDSDHVSFYFSTQDVETMGDWRGHRVTINGIEIGRIKNLDHAGQDTDTVRFAIQRNDMTRLLNGKDNFSLGIELEKRPATPGLSDDFVLVRIATSSNLSVALGWQ